MPAKAVSPHSENHLRLIQQWGRVRQVAVDVLGRRCYSAPTELTGELGKTAIEGGMGNAQL